VRAHAGESGGAPNRKYSQGLKDYREWRGLSRGRLVFFRPSVCDHGWEGWARAAGGRNPLSAGRPFGDVNPGAAGEQLEGRLVVTTAVMSWFRMMAP